MRTLTFLFADLRDYTAFVERHGDVAATTLIADYRRLVRAEVAKAKGAEVKTEGDSFYVVFEGAGDAVRCAMSVLREADRYSRERPDRPMRVGIGIHAGEPQPHEGQYVGGAVIVAARLAQASAAGELLVSDVVRGLLPKGTAPGMQERQGLVLKGIADAPRAFSVSWTAAEPAAAAEPRGTVVEAAAPTDRSMLCPRVIGRDSELAALRALLGEAAAGQGRTVLIAGEAGVGKSATLRTFLERAAAANSRVLRGECSEVEARRPFGPFIDAFVAASLPVPSELSQVGPGAMAAAEVERYRVHGAFAQALGELAESASVVIAIEDVHWADSATLELIPYLARKLRERRILLLYTYRDDEMHRLHPLRGTLAELKRLRLANEIRLARLTADEVAAMIQETMGLGRAPTTAFREAITERCEGNPFFIEEVLRTLVERGDLEYRDGAWRRTKEVADLALPDSVRDAVQERLATLTPTARRVLQVAAVIGQRFGFELLQRVTGEREGDVLDALREAIEAQVILEELEVDEEGYRFRHALTRESVMAELMRREKRSLHLRVAEAIESMAKDPEARAEELAYHFDEAGSEERAYRYHEAAARHAEGVFAYARALEHLERAIELAPAGTIGPLQLRLARSAAVTLDLARAVRAADGAVRNFEEAADVRQHATALSLLGTYRRGSGDTAGGNRDLANALAMLEPLGPTPELMAAYRRAGGAAAVDERPEGVDLARRAATLAEAIGDKAELARSLRSLGTALLTTGDPREGLERLRASVALANETEAHMDADVSYHNLMAALLWLGAPRAEREAVREERMAHARRHRIRTDGILISETESAFDGGDWDLALRVIEEGRSDSYQSLNRDHIETLIVLAREGPQLAQPFIDQAQRKAASRLSPQDRAGAHALRVVIAAISMDQAAALRAGDGLERFTTRHVLVDTGIVAALASAFVAGNEDAAAQWAGRASGRQSYFGSGVAAGVKLLGEGSRAWLDRDTDRATDTWRSSLQVFETSGWRAQLHGTFVRQMVGALLAGLGKRDEARQLLEGATRYWRKAKATWYLGQLRAWAAERGIELSNAEVAAAN